jgi:membrane protein involved in colicin uptake
MAQDWKGIFFRGGQFLDAIKKRENLVNTEMEEVLAKGEKHFEILEKERLDKIQAERVAQITFYIEDADQRDFTKFEEDEFEAFLAMKKKAYEDAIAEAKKVEQERLAKEKADELAKANDSVSATEKLTRAKKKSKAELETIKAETVSHDKV